MSSVRTGKKYHVASIVLGDDWGDIDSLSFAGDIAGFFLSKFKLPTKTFSGLIDIDFLVDMKVGVYLDVYKMRRVLKERGSIFSDGEEFERVVGVVVGELRSVSLHGVGCNRLGKIISAGCASYLEERKVIFECFGERMVVDVPLLKFKSQDRGDSVFRIYAMSCDKKLIIFRDQKTGVKFNVKFQIPGSEVGVLFDEHIKNTHLVAKYLIGKSKNIVVTEILRKMTEGEYMANKKSGRLDKYLYDEEHISFQQELIE